MRSYHRHYVKIAKRLGLTRIAIVHQGSKHPRLVGEYDGQQVSFVIGCSKPTDQRTRGNTEAYFRRTLKRGGAN